MRQVLWLCAITLLGLASGCTTWNCSASCVGGGFTGVVTVCTSSEADALAQSNDELEADCAPNDVLFRSCVNTLTPCFGSRVALQPTADPISQ